MQWVPSAVLVAAGKRRSLTAMILAASGLLVLTPSPAAALQPYEVKFTGKSCCKGEVIESGATEPQYFTVENSGSIEWEGPESRVIGLGVKGPVGNESEPGTEGPPPSIFVAPGWVNEYRPIRGLEEPVPTGHSYKAAFDVTAPPVGERREFIESFAMVAEGLYWLDNQSGEKGLGPNLYLRLIVVPQKRPEITMSMNPSTVRPGEPFSVTVSASAVAAVNHVELKYRSQSISAGPERSPEIKADEQPRWTHTFALTDEGTGTLEATAYDDAGLATSAAIPITTPLPPTPNNPGPSPTPPSPNHAPLVHPFSVEFFKLKTHTKRVRVTHFVVEGLTRGDTVSATCHGCAGRRSFGPIRALGRSLTFAAGHLEFAARSRIVVDVTAPGSRGRYMEFGYDLRTRKLVKLGRGCLHVNSRSRGTCS